MQRIAIWLCLALLAGAAEVSELKTFPVEGMDGVISRTGVKFVRDPTADGNGSLRLKAQKPTTFHLYETGDLDIEQAVIFYRAKVRTGGVKGEAYLEMWCHFPGRGEYFSRGLQYSLSGNNNWTSVETSFMLRKGENPDNIRLNLVINGRGTAWVDDIRLEKGPLPPGA